MLFIINPAGAQVNYSRRTMAADALAPCVPGTSAVMVLIMYVNKSLFSIKMFVTTCVIWMSKNANMFLYFKKDSAPKWLMVNAKGVQEIQLYSSVYQTCDHHPAEIQSVPFKWISTDDTDSLIGTGVMSLLY